jgi:cyclic beta-1,2-glucan synthetase
MPTLQHVTQLQLDSPLRGEPFSAEHLWSYAEGLAAAQIVRRGGADRRLVDRFESNSRFIAAAYRAISESIRDGEPLAADAEWLVDNYYVVEDQLREIREDLPRNYYLELPKLASGPFENFPRVHELAHELVVHSDSSLDEELISGFIAAYQRIVPLTSGEIWAVPIMLRLVLVENLRRLCGHILAARVCRKQAKQILELWSKDHAALPRIDFDQDCSMLIMELIECLRAPSAGEHSVAPHELAGRIGQSQEMLDECVRREQQRLAANQVSIGNAITSMRLISALDWTLFFERVSLVEQILRRDPVGIYAAMDFATRDQYRHQIERIAKRSDEIETQIASAALHRAELARAAGAPDAARHHVGYYLIDDGQRELELEFKYRPKFAERSVRFVRRYAAAIYLGGIILVTAIGAASLFAACRAAGASLTASIFLGCLAIPPASELAVGLINFLVTISIRPRLLPKMDFADEVPSQWQTLVVMPTMLTSLRAVGQLLERLEVHYLANLESGLSFALVTDYADSPAEETAEDQQLLAAAKAAVDALNIRYPGEGERRFHLLHRRRTWNPVENLWMGWERKRGKLVELNRLLRGATDTTFIVAPEDQAALVNVKFVITLDSDTRLPHAAARRLAGALAHPLNRPHFNKANGRVTRGYGVLQPRVSVSLASANRTLFSRLFSNSGGLDPYSSAVSDVYQDLFGEASYTGKGIYDVDAFLAATKDTFPANHILSHDLIEGCHARAGAVTDVELFDEYPTSVEADARRQHRWTRGDWQLLPWLFPNVPTPHGRRKNPLTAVSRWKVFDNLRRSLVPAFLMALCVAGLYAAAQTAWLTTAATVAVLASPFCFHILSAVALWRPGQYWKRELRDIAATACRTLLQCTLALTLLPYRAYNLADAVVRTLYRLTISRRKLLEWETSEAAERRLNRKSNSLRTMLWIPASCLAAGLMLSAAARWTAIPLLGLWFTSPWIANYLRRPFLRAAAPLSATDRLALRRIARRTWAFFEQFVGPEDNWLPPDNFQEFPRPKVAHRISPTNEGLYVMSAIAARDFGYIGISDLVELLERNLDRWTSLERYFGHFYNWYNTTTLTPLAPRYISTADSGNLAASFLAAQQGLSEILEAPLVGPFLSEGITDSVRLAEEALERLQPRGARFVSPALTALEAELAQLRAAAEKPPVDLSQWWHFVARLTAHADRLPRLLHDFEVSLGLKAGEFASKVMSLKAGIDGLKQDAHSLIAWSRHLTSRDNTPGAAQSNGQPGLTSHVNIVSRQPAWLNVLSEVGATSNLNDVATLAQRLATHVQSLRASLADSDLSAHEINDAAAWLAAFEQAVTKASDYAIDLHDRCLRLGRRYEALAKEMDFTLLYNPQRRLFSVGLNLDDGRLDRAHYDMLASESRIASLVAIAKGDAEHRHWFQLGRALTETPPGRVGLLSWGGTMFEYLMPTLFSPNVSGSLLERSCDTAVERQVSYGRQRRVPWGISESTFALQAANGDYHYQSFGVPGLGLKRGLGKDLVISPYSTALALAIRPAAAVANFRALAAEGAEGPWGFYDALDYTPERVPEGERRVVVFCYMAHHQGMILAALANFLRDRPMQRRFQRQPLVRSTDLLLQERVPVAVLHFNPQDDAAVTVPSLPVVLGPVSRQLSTPHTVVPRAHLFSNGEYSVMVTNAGGGYSRCHDLALTRWRADTTRDNWGQFVYVRDAATQKVWSAQFHPTEVEPDNYEVTYSIDKAEFRRHDDNLETHLELTISRESNAEVRQVTITNHGRKPATVELTSYAEIVLCPAAADAAHPAFNKLFVETEYLGDCPALLARRRPREAGAAVPWAVHVLAAQPVSLTNLQFETDRARFLGRGRTPAAPAALDPGAVLSGTTGPVLDAIFSLRGQLHVAPGESGSLAFVTAYATSREEALQLADQYRDPRVVQRTFEMAWAHSQVEMRHLHVSPASVQMFQRLASALLYPDASLRAPLSVLKANRRGQRSLWRYGISGDEPIALLRVSRSEHRTLVRELLLAHEFWHAHGLKADLVILNEHPAGYFDGFQEQLLELVHTTTRLPVDKPGGIFLLRAAQLSPEDSVLLQEVAAINLQGERGSLAQQVEESRVPPPVDPPKLRPLRSAVEKEKLPSRPGSTPMLEFANQLGGFDDSGDYVIELSDTAVCPAPWSNVIANPQFGFITTESGGGYTWGGNSRENKLTAWSNDPITDPPSEILYIRDEETGLYWTPTPLPTRGKSEYSIRHGRGFTRFNHAAYGIDAELLLSIAPDVCIKFACLKLRNGSKRPRLLSATYYAEWVLGVSRDSTHMHVYTAQDPTTGAVFAYNNYNEEFPDQTVVLHVLGKPDSISGDRTEFLGRNGSHRRPAALARAELSGRTGAGIDPCGAVQKKIRLDPGEEVEVIFLLGWTDRASSAADLLAGFQTPQQVHRAIEQTTEFWRRTLQNIEVRTPNRAFDILVNHWLLYQVLSCRVWGRSAFYQSGGAFGFRDQLQDVMALVYSRPEDARNVILQAASRQFEQGDVQHWWHPPSGRGVRTRFSDDYLWLPYVVSHYVATTGDEAILEEQVPYVHSVPLDAGQEERYELPEVSNLVEDLYAHCLRAIDHGFRFGAHGLPLMGCGDWNDGMNKVGADGKGESVWLAWFLRSVLHRFIPLVEARGDAQRAATYRAEAQRLLQAVDENAWDGKWYRRAYFGDGTPLGSIQNDDCQIDSLAQSWSVIAGGDPARSRIAMRAADERLVRPDDRLVQLLDPPFDKTKLEPGYIKGYPPGIRENGGQYTHAALWFVQALTLEGKGTKAAEVFDLLNPILTATSARAPNYRVEPYVVAADVYSMPPHVGRGGWTWYTGSASWMYRVAIESMLGLQIRGDRLLLAPCISSKWHGYEVRFRRGATKWTLLVSNPDGLEDSVKQVCVDNRQVDRCEVELVDDGLDHLIEVTLGRPPLDDRTLGKLATTVNDTEPPELSPEVLESAFEQRQFP